MIDFENAPEESRSQRGAGFPTRPDRAGPRCGEKSKACAAIQILCALALLLVLGGTALTAAPAPFTTSPATPSPSASAPTVNPGAKVAPAPAAPPAAKPTPAPVATPTPAERFNIAKEKMADGDYGEAAYQLRELADAGNWSHGALHNLGNAEWKVSRPGHAILAWERARALDPSDRNTTANLNFARKKATLSDPERRWYEQYSEWLPSLVWMLVAGLSLWGGIALLCLPRLLTWRRAGWHQGLAALLLALFLLTTPALIGLWSRSNMGVVLEDDTRLRLTPTREGEELGKLPAGEVARAEEIRGNYVYIRADHDRAGWVDNRDFAKIWP